MDEEETQGRHGRVKLEGARNPQSMQKERKVMMTIILRPSRLPTIPMIPTWMHRIIAATIHVREMR